MQKNLISLYKLPVGSFGKVKDLRVMGHNRRRLQDLGLVPGTYVESLRESPLGDPIAYQIRGAVIALRSEEASKVLVEIA